MDRMFVNQNGSMTLVSTPRPGPIELCCRLGDVSGDAKRRSTETSSEGAIEETLRFLVNKHASTGASPVVSVQLLSAQAREMLRFFPRLRVGLRFLARLGR